MTFLDLLCFHPILEIVTFPDHISQSCYHENCWNNLAPRYVLLMQIKLTMFFASSER